MDKRSVMQGKSEITKVGILTYQNTLNYGAALQCYALRRCLADLGFDAWVIDYACNKVERAECVAFSLRSPASVLKYLMKARKRAAFKRFKKALHLSARCDIRTIRDVSRDFDCIVVGSDQVWNSSISHDDGAFFLTFEDDPKRCKSYAASIGTCGFPSDEPYATYLSHFSSLLVRERTAAEEIRRLLPYREDVRQVIDPTLLLSREAWESIARFPVCARRRRYILAYSVTDFELCAEVARELAAQRGCDIIQVCQRRVGRIKGAIHLTHASPEEFLGLFANADATVVSSFHGVCFSLIFQKDLYCILRKDNATSSRFRDLLDELQVESGVLQGVEDLAKVKPVDFGVVSKRLSAMREASVAALAESLGA